MGKQKRDSRRAHITERDSYSQMPEKRVWDLDVETLLSFPKSGKGVVSEQLKGAHFVSGEANALQSEVQLEGIILSYIQISKQKKGAGCDQWRLSVYKSLGPLGALPRSQVLRVYLAHSGTHRSSD